MERIEFLIMVGLIFLKVIGAVLGIMFVSYLSTLIYDEVQILRQKSPYEIWLAAMVGAEFIVYGRPKKPLVSVPSAKYHGRHREEDPFIHDLTVEMRATPGTLCYNKTLSFETAEDDQLCGVF